MVYKYVRIGPMINNGSFVCYKATQTVNTGQLAERTPGWISQERYLPSVLGTIHRKSLPSIMTRAPRLMDLLYFIIRNHTKINCFLMSKHQVRSNSTLEIKKRIQSKMRATGVLHRFFFHMYLIATSLREWNK